MPSSASSTSSSTLLQRVGGRDPQAWQRLTELYGPLVFHWCRRCGLPEEDAGDVLQEVFASVARAIQGFLQRGDGAFRGWLWTITRNQIRDHCRRRARQIEAAGGTDAQMQLCQIPDTLTDDSQDPAEPSATSSLFRRALELVRAEFNDRTWQAFWRSTVDEQTTADIAQDLGMTANHVRQCKSRVLRRLREELGEL